MTVSWWPTARGGLGPLGEGEPVPLVVFGSFVFATGFEPVLWLAILDRSGLPSRNGREYWKLSELGMGKSETSAGTG